MLADNAPAALRRFDTVTVLDLEDDPPSVSRALSAFEARASLVRIVLAYDPDPALAEAFASAATIRARLLDRGYAEECHAPDLWRVAGLRDAERELFRADVHSQPLIQDASGLALLGAPQGEGVGLIVAREVRRLLAEERVAAEDVLVLVRSWDDHADAVLGVLRSWGLPVATIGRPIGLNAAPAVALVLRALRLPIDGWEAVEVIRTLRHGRFRPDWPEAATPESAARAASAVRDAQVFAGRKKILAALDRMADESKNERLRSRAAEARALVNRLIVAVEASHRIGSWTDHARRLGRLVESLGMVVEGDEALERLRDAVEDAADVREGAGETRPVPFAEFVRAVETLVGESSEANDRIAPGSLVMATVDGAAGARARHIVLANLAEGTFPSRAAVESVGGSRSFGREMNRFLRVIGSASEGLTLVSPTRDEKGQEVLAAGFLDDLSRQLDPRAAHLRREVLPLVDPTLIDRPDLALAPADARARAVALACLRQDTSTLAALAREPAHRPVLLGAAAALSLTADRLGSRVFSHYDGVIAEPVAVAKVAAEFGAQHVFSASQLESYLTCPFQFFAKYVLELKPVDDYDDLDEDFRFRGIQVHQLLEELELLHRLDDRDRLALTPIVIATGMSAELTDGSETDSGLQEIEKRRMERTLTEYSRQMDQYREQSKIPGGTPAHFEVVFGGNQGNEENPCLVLGEGARAVRIQGKIDRLDVVETPEGPKFRVIDYKTGSRPTNQSVKDLLMVQLPLYALAVERLGLAGEATTFSDLGYWALRDGGFKRVPLDGWPDDRERLESKVLETAASLRSGLFIVQPQKDDCERTCDFALVCRIGQVRRVQKTVATGRSAP